ncbi:mavicyanin-like [Pyrus communis]|uniref:mavicyanin-like n=1 Tax=Pyrus communis TaxID=23211 RepID=UPI0035C06737
MGRTNTVLLALVFAALLTKETLASQHVVGDSQGWEQSTDLNSWASGQKFKVGDQLVFKYTSGLHSVVELPNESAYKSCDAGSALDTKSSGNDVVKLTKAGTRYFACGTSGHCDQGMKMKITTVDGNAPSSPSSPSSSSSDASPPASASAAASSSFLHSAPSLFVIAALSATLLLSVF